MDSGAGMRALRSLAWTVPIGMTLLALVEGRLIGFAAVHLCRWPATISCDFGVPYVWGLLWAGLWALVVVASADVLGYVRVPTPDAGRRVLAWMAWGPAVVVATALTVMDRTLEAGDLLVGALVLLAALAILDRTAAARQPERRWIRLGVLLPMAVVIAFVPLWAPRAFEAAERTDPARQDIRRRADAQRCMDRMEAGRARGGADEKPACEYFPDEHGVPPDKVVTPPDEVVTPPDEVVTPPG